MKKPSLLLISIYPPKGESHSNAGGVASYTKNLASSLCEDYLVTVVCDIRTIAESYNENGIHVRRAFKKNIFFFVALIKEIWVTKTDVVHIQQELNLYGSPVSAVLLNCVLFSSRYILRRNTVITIHGVVNLEKVDKTFVKENNSGLPPFFVKLALKIIYIPYSFLTNTTIVHENVFKDILVSQYSAKETNVHVVNHGVEELQQVLRGPARKEIHLDVNAHAVLFMGYLTGYKGIDILIEAFALYQSTDTNAYLIIGAGKHPKLTNDATYLAEYNRLETKAAELIPKDKYRWVGFIDEKDIGLYYSACDISVYPYTNQISSSGPMAIAIGYRKPFLASNVFSDVVAICALFDGDALSLKCKLSEYFSNTSLQQEIFEYVQSKHGQLSWKNVGKMTQSFYK